MIGRVSVKCRQPGALALFIPGRWSAGLSNSRRARTSWVARRDRSFVETSGLQWNLVGVTGFALSLQFTPVPVHRRGAMCSCARDGAMRVDDATDDFEQFIERGMLGRRQQRAQTHAGRRWTQIEPNEASQAQLLGDRERG